MIAEEQRYLVAMLGARMHYAVPRILNSAGMLESLCTDGYVSSRTRQWLMRFPGWVLPATRKRLASRCAKDIPSDRVKSFAFLGLRYRWRLAQAQGGAQRREAFMSAGRAFCSRIRHQDWGGAAGIYAWNSAALEIFDEARKRGVRTFLEQCSTPRELECRIMEREHAVHPDWEEPFEMKAVDQQYADRERREWELSDCILCPSDFVRDGIAKLGGPVERCKVVPYGVEAQGKGSAVASREGPLRVLTVGRVSLAKGVACIAAAAQSLKDCAEFRFVGESRLLSDREELVRKHIDLVGPVPRSEVAEHYEWADIFLLPSLHEGSATVCYEALSYGLPVICTPNTGSVVTDCYDGFIVDPGDVDAIAGNIRALARDRKTLSGMQANALKTASENSLESYALRLKAALTQIQDAG